MAHHTVRDAYKSLADRLNRFPQGAPPSDVLYRILRLLFTERDAELVSLLPVKPFTAEQAAAAWEMSPAAADAILQQLADRTILLDVTRKGRSVYTLPPPMAGFFEFAMMRVRADVDQKALSELFYQYINVEEEFIKNLILGGETQVGRVYVQEPALPSPGSLHVLDFDQVSEVYRTASHIAVGLCYCRHKMSHLGRACAAPLDNCITLNQAAESLTRHGAARRIELPEALDLLQQAYGHNLVQFGENVQRGVNFICNCCSCCCEAMIAARRFGFLHPVHTSGFLPEIDRERCLGCGTCLPVCPVAALSLGDGETAGPAEPGHPLSRASSLEGVSGRPLPGGSALASVSAAAGPGRPPRRRACLDREACLGCGVCVRNCPTRAISLRHRDRKILTPVDTSHRFVQMAIERGRLGDLLFDNQLLVSHRAMAALLGAVFRLPPVKRLMAKVQLKSRYLDRIIEWWDH